MLNRRLRRWSNIEPAKGERDMFSVSLVSLVQW